jgi:hypothetical protein
MYKNEEPSAMSAKMYVVGVKIDEIERVLD